jgi:hypothetical protein
VKRRWAEEDVAGDLVVDEGDQRNRRFALFDQQGDQPGFEVRGESCLVNGIDGGEIGLRSELDVECGHRRDLGENASTPRMGD